MFLRFLFFVLCLTSPAMADPDFAAAGRVERMNGEGTCSAVLVRPDVIATAAHCQSVRMKFFRPGDGKVGEVYEIVEYILHPLYDRSTNRVDWKLRFDIAVGRLAKLVPANRVLPMTVGDDAQPGEQLLILSWRGNTDRPRQRPCSVIEGIRGLVTLDCQVRGGESGAPVVRQTDEGLELVAIISSSNNQLEKPVAQASDVRLRLPPLFDLIDAATP